MIHHLGLVFVTACVVALVALTLSRDLVNLLRDSSELRGVAPNARRAGVVVALIPTVSAGAFALAITVVFWRVPSFMSPGFFIALFGFDGLRWVVAKLVRSYSPAHRVTEPGVARAHDVKLAARRADEARLQAERDFSEQIARKRMSA